MAEILIGDYGLITSIAKGAEVTAAATDHVAEGMWVEITGCSSGRCVGNGGLKGWRSVL